MLILLYLNVGRCGVTRELGTIRKTFGFLGLRFPILHRESGGLGEHSVIGVSVSIRLLVRKRHSAGVTVPFSEILVRVWVVSYRKTMRRETTGNGY